MSAIVKKRASNYLLEIHSKNVALSLQKYLGEKAPESWLTVRVSHDFSGFSIVYSVPSFSWTEAARLL